MPTASSLTYAVGFEGTLTGVPTNPTLPGVISDRAQCNISGGSKQVYQGTGIVIPVSGTLSLNLTFGLVNPLGESASFSTILGVWIEHATTSLSTSGITAFGGGGNEFQGPKAAGDKDTLQIGEWTAIGKPASVIGWTVDAGHKLIDIVNLDATALHTATVNIFVVGTV